MLMNTIGAMKNDESMINGSGGRSINGFKASQEEF